MIALWLALAAAAQSVCPSGCAFATVQQAVDSLPDGGAGVFLLSAGPHEGAVVVDGGRRVVLATLAPDPVTLTAPPEAGSVVVVRGASTLDLVAVSIDADGLRGIDASEGSVVTASLGVAYGRGVVGEGALVRLRDAELVATLYGFLDGHTFGDGGLISAVDSDVRLDAVSLTDGDGADGGAIYARATGTRRELVLDAVTIANTGATGNGGAIAISGAIDATMTGLLIEEARATNGGAVSVVGDDAVVTLDGVLISACEAYVAGGALYQAGSVVTLTTSAIGDGAGLDGGAVALVDGDLRIESTVIFDNLAISRAGGVFATGGSLSLRDVSLARNSGSEGGGLWLGGSVSAPELARVQLCANGSTTRGGGAWVGTTSDLVWTNLRLLDNRADLDGGGFQHLGPGALSLESVNLLGNTSGSGGGSAISTAGALSLTDALVGFSTGGIAIRRVSDAPVTLAGGTVWWANAQGDAVDLTPTTPGVQRTDPELAGYTPGEACETIQDWGGWYGPLRDQGSEGRQDPDGTRIDVGAYGGPDADPSKWTTDADGDGAPVLYDCDEQDPAVYPLATDPPYDGLDANCDLADDYDADGDGHRHPDFGGDDCDDARPDVFPGADEVASDPPVDQDCDGRFDADDDGFEPPVDCDDADPDAYPGAVDDDPARDLDCNGFVDDPRVIRPVSCDGTGGPGPGWLAWLVLVAAPRRRR